MCSLITPAFRCTGPLLQPPDNSSPLGALRLHRRDEGELLRCPLGSNDQTLDHSPGLQPYPGLNHRLGQVSESTRGRSPPGALPRRTRSGAGAHGLSGPSSTCAAMRRGLHTIPPRASHCPLLPRDGAAIFRWGRPLLGTPAGQLRHPTPSRAAVGAAVSRPGPPAFSHSVLQRPDWARLLPRARPPPALSPSDKATPRAPHLHVPSPPSLSGGPGHSPARGRGCSRAPRPLVPRAVQEADFGTGHTSPSPEGHSLA
ncbi:hypothetical protein NDU88_002049 [Pleurodeles waltl]|uniref:Uncharacterized protein n=1 Tax=Pleurodeles waltl TaxID=8319 RepID=A0AAV7SBK9_PLEWA|nr:hypothetical protein NDU88_002049 [Pleurodeles waltl]